MRLRPTVNNGMRRHLSNQYALPGSTRGVMRRCRHQGERHELTWRRLNNEVIRLAGALTVLPWLWEHESIPPEVQDALKGLMLRRAWRYVDFYEDCDEEDRARHPSTRLLVADLKIIVAVLDGAT